MEYQSKGAGTAALTTGIIGTALGVLNGGLGGVLNMGGNCGYATTMNAGCCSENTVVTRYEQNLIQEIAAKDSENALLRSNIYTDGKLVEIVKDYTTQINAIKERLCENEKQQAMYNGANTAAMNCMSSQIAQLFALTKLVVPNSSVCPGWGNVNITPATTPATA